MFLYGLGTNFEPLGGLGAMSLVWRGDALRTVQLVTGRDGAGLEGRAVASAPFF